MAHLNALAEDYEKVKAELASLRADIISALGNEVPREGPRLAAMRIRSERDNWKRLCVERGELLEKAEAAIARYKRFDRLIEAAMGAKIHGSNSPDLEVEFDPESIQAILSEVVKLREGEGK